ncbi:VOC family protein [Cryobacterium frigoriphilum]|uniref:VOC family protein n=1 Tax=Cryobacterium frigoriphilum TaxID=1259150 RepID=UPI001580139F|nr:VOC family protein [Cryobacterium frigoriphilum]
MTSQVEIYSVLPAKDLQRARQFYSDAFGMEPDQDMPEGLIYRTAGGAMILIYETPFAGTNQATAIGLVTDTFDTDMADLRAKGVKFEEYDLPGLKTENGVVEMEGAKGAWFKDTEGNIVSLSEDLFALRARSAAQSQRKEGASDID